MLNIFKKYASNDFVVKLFDSFLGRGSFIVFTLLFSFVCTRLYGAEIFGKYTYAMTIVQVLMIISRAGLDNGLMYSIPKNKYKHVSLSFMVSFVIFVFSSLFLATLTNNDYLKFMLPLIWFLSAEELFFGMYRAEGKIKEFYIINGFFSMLLRVVLIIIFFFVFGKNEYSLAIGVYISLLYSISTYYYQNRFKFGRLIFDKSYLAYSLPLLLATMMGTLINRIDIIMIGSLLSNTDVGIYQITIQVSNMVSVLLLIFNTVLAPRISELYHRGKDEELKLLYVKATRFLAVFSLITTTLLLIFSQFVLNLFGEDFVMGQTALIYRSIGQFVNIAVGGVWLMLSMTGKPKFQLYANICALLINITLNAILIPSNGINGAAFASMVTLSFTNIVGYIVVSKRFGVKVFKLF
ncbi:flippase [Rossellomorea sp. NPDC077527]|uniref:flippase n=1 Tax=Rossellomorea sp. NPDC077527 TaxID=3364510 RepID=UPI0037C8D0B7